MSTSNPYAAPARARETVVVEARKSTKPTESAVPAGTISEVLEWVGEDVQRAELALEHETANLNRKTLVTRLNEVVGTPEVVEADADEDVEETQDDE